MSSAADAHWRNSMKHTRFFLNTDARAALMFLLLLVHARWWTFLLVIATMVVFYIAEQRGLTFEAALRALRVWIVGHKRPRISEHHKPRWVDFG